jgi:hypothetical protein
MSQQEVSNVLEGRSEVQEIWALFREVARRQEETDKKIDRLSDEIELVNKAVGDLTGKWGKFVEGLVAPGAVRMFTERGIDVRWTSTRNRVRKDGEEMEIDVILENSEYVVAIEVSSTLGVADVNEHIEKLKRFRELFPRFSRHKLIGAVAGIVIDESADKYAYRQGLFVIAQTGETVKILNDSKFKPKEW